MKKKIIKRGVYGIVCIVSIFLALLVFETYNNYQYKKHYQEKGKIEDCKPKKSLKIAKKYAPIYKISAKEKHKMLDVRYMIKKKGNAMCIQYWAHWDYSSTNKLLNMIGFSDHAMDLEPFFVYVKNSKVTHVAYTAGHGTRGTQQAKNIVLKGSRPLVGIVSGGHHYYMPKKTNPANTKEKSKYKMILLDIKMIEKWNRVLRKLSQPGTMNNIVANPWDNFTDRFGISYNVFLGDHSGMVFYKPVK